MIPVSRIFCPPLADGRSGRREILERNRMRAFPKKGRLPVGASHASPAPWPAPHHSPHEYSVVLLGVMYPSAVPQRHQNLQHKRPPLPPEILINRRGTDLIFYDPILTRDTRNPGQSPFPQPNTERHLTSETQQKPAGTGSRRASIEAVARDLVLLLLRKRP